MLDLETIGYFLFMEEMEEQENKSRSITQDQEEDSTDEVKEDKMQGR